MERIGGVILESSQLLLLDFFSDDLNVIRSSSAEAADCDCAVPTMNNNIISTTTTSGASVNTGLHLHTMMNVEGSSTSHEDATSKDELANTEAELGEIKEENQRLKNMLSQVTDNYNALHIKLLTLMQQKSQRIGSSQSQEVIDEKRAILPRQFMDLGPVGMNNEVAFDANGGSRDVDEETMTCRPSNGKTRHKSTEQDSQEWIPNKTPKLSHSKDPEQARDATMRKARVSVRARSEAPMIADGCQWRKYGQKMAKGNPCPRAYYRCTMAAGCPVRKQVQRCVDDRTVLTTTYEGKHNHPLPPAAVAMASTTSAAATMLLSGSMSSADNIMSPDFLTGTVLPPSSVATISASAPFPTVTLDLTSTPTPLDFRRPTAHFDSQPPSSPQVFGQSLYNQSNFAEAKPLLQADTLSAAATAAIAVDPGFTAALVAAITSTIRNANHCRTSNNSNKDNNNK